MTKEITILPVEEVTEIKTQITTVQKAANDLSITSQIELDIATELLSNVKKIENLITERKTEITKPLMTSLASIRGLFAPLETAHKLAKQVIKEKILAYTIEESDRIEKEKDKITSRVERGLLRPDTAVAKMEDIKGPKSNIRTLTKVRIIDETIIPREYLVPNLTLITEAVIRKGFIVPGVEKYEEKSVIAK